VLTCLIGLLSWYTCGLIVQIGAYSTEYHDFSDCVGEYFEDASSRRWVGELGRYLALIVSIGMMCAVCLSYHFIIVGTIVEMLGEHDGNPHRILTRSSSRPLPILTHSSPDPHPILM
jgi:hypothetical protein